MWVYREFLFLRNLSGPAWKSKQNGPRFIQNQFGHAEVCVLNAIGSVLLKNGGLIVLKRSPDPSVPTQRVHSTLVCLNLS